MSRKGKIAGGAVLGLLIAVGTAYALANFSLTLGDVIGGYNFNDGMGVVPAIAQIHGFVMKPGDTIPWHHHKATSYVILVRGDLTETHVISTNPDTKLSQCGTVQVSGGTAFVEVPNEIHTVTNTGNRDAVIWWATVFPKSDGITEFSPAFKAGGVIGETSPPTCSAE